MAFVSSSLSVSGESVKVKVKHYTELTTKEAVVDEAYLLSRISHEAFPFVFGVVFGELHNMLVLEVCGISEGIEHSFTIHRALQSKSVFVTKTSWLLILMRCCEGFYYLHSTGIVHNDIKGDNILIAKVNLGEWQPKIIDFNKACEIKTSKIKEIPVSERTRLKLCHKHTVLIQHCMMASMLLVQLQMFIALVIWQVKLPKQRNQN